MINKVSGTVLIKAKPRDIRLVEEYLNSTKMIVQRQVMLEAKVIEVRLSSGNESGINWSAFRSGGNSNSAIGIAAPGSTIRPIGANGVATTLSGNGNVITPGVVGSVVATALGGGFAGLAFQTTNFAALLNFLETQGGLSVLSSPRVATLNNQKAILKVGKDEVYVTGFTTAQQTTNNGGVQETSSYGVPVTSQLFSGISLDVTPQIDEDGYVVLHVHPAISNVEEVSKTFNLGNDGVVSLPFASRSVNETDSVVRVLDGNIVAIGGMMSQYFKSDREGLPGTSGSRLQNIAGQSRDLTAKREMVILLKPTVISDDKAWVRDLEQSAERVRNFALPPLAVPAQ